MNDGAKRITRLGLLTALALILGYIESLFPIAPGLPGIKPGLSNCAVLYALCLIRFSDAALLLLLKVTLSSLLFGSPVSFFYSLAGGTLSLLLMYALRRLPGVSVVTLSIAGATAHNLAQLGVATLLMGLRPTLVYAPVLLLSSFATGLITGLITRTILRYIEKENR